MGQQYSTDAWKFWDIYHAVLKGDLFRNVVSDWTIILYFDCSVVYAMELSDWFLFLYSDWWMSDRLKYSYSVPLRRYRTDSSDRRHLADGSSHDRHSAAQTSTGRKQILGD
jgi:hypothetical protein